MSMNVYQMYVANGNAAGFWVQRNSWGRTVAYVEKVCGLSEGPIPGKPPYFGRPDVLVTLWQLRRDDSGWNCVGVGQQLSCPNTYAYRLVDWSQFPCRSVLEQLKGI